MRNFKARATNEYKVHGSTRREALSFRSIFPHTHTPPNETTFANPRALSTLPHKRALHLASHRTLHNLLLQCAVCPNNADGNAEMITMCAPFLHSQRSIPVVSLSNKRQRAPQDESGLSISKTHLVESLVAIQGGHPHVFTRTIGKYPMLLTVSNQGAPHTHGLSSPHPPRGEPHQKTRWPPAPVRSCFSASLRKGAPSPRPPIARNSRSPKATATRMPTRGPRLLDRQGRFLGRLLP